MIRTTQQLQLLFQKSRESNAKKKLKEKQLYKKASLLVKKELDKKKQQTNKQPEQLNNIIHISIYKTTTIERYTAEEDLYQTREELMNDKTGEINWILWDYLVDKLRKTL